MALRPYAVGRGKATRYQIGQGSYDWPQAAKLAEISLLLGTRLTDYITTDFALMLARRTADLEERIEKVEKATAPESFRRAGW
jgi:hypothetical protein